MTVNRLAPLVPTIALWIACAPLARAHSEAGGDVWKEGADPWVIGGLFVAMALYAMGTTRLWQQAGLGAGVPVWRAGCYIAGLGILAVALLPPVDTLGSELFSMHMLQHELLMLGAAPLLVAGMPLGVFLWAFSPPWRKRVSMALRWRPLRVVWRRLMQPLVAWSIHAAMLWAWHAPRFFEAGLLDDDVHVAQHLCFLISALLFWSALIGARSPIRDGSAVVYLLTTLIHSGMLGALLTFSPRAWYPFYAGRTEAWGISLLADQQLGGLVMWVPAGMVLILAALVFASRVLRLSTSGRRA
ncbi:MAG TPA: cytochrome c oxidase assembly protein [Noviherbaspirillum sp.]|nr:cytochrome c oxidase assembly protein [Noviherbaspirillum sp.]